MATTNAIAMATRVLSALSILALAGPARSSVCPTSNVIQPPAEFQWTAQNGYWSGTLELGAATLNIGGYTFTTRAYRQAGGTFGIPGPTIRMTPGQTYVLTLKNLLPYATPSTVMNDFKDPNITNLHTHGLHVSPASPADDVLRLINGGYCGDYVYAVPSDHMGGTLWYHPHHHGSTYLQVSGGAVGLLVVNDSNDGIPAGVAGMAERLLAVAFVDPSVAGTGGDTLLSGTLAPTWTVNGKIQGNLCTPVNEWQHWRVLLAHHDASPRTLAVGAGCQVALLARDGVWRNVAPLALATGSLDLTGASRADLAVKCSGDSSITVNNTLVARVYADSTLPANSTVGPYSNGATGTTWSARRPTYLRDLRHLASVESHTINMGARTINGSKFDMNVPTFTIQAGNLQDWTIKGAGAHPFHIHVYHFQMNGACGSFEDGEYYDTLAAGPCHIRFDWNPATSSVYDGATIMHCHILDHEDQGAMGWTDLVGGMGPPSYPAAGYRELYQCAP
jgi:suppressor of ftsI